MNTTIEKKPNLLIFGEALVDEFPRQQVIGGAPFNVARSLSLLGARPLMISRIGRDAAGALIQAEAERTGLSMEGMQFDDAQNSGRVLVHLAEQGDVCTHRFEILANQAYDYIDAHLLDVVLQRHFHDVPPDLIYFGSLIQRSEVSRETLVGLLESDVTEGASKFLDLNLRDGQASVETICASLNYCDMVKLNEDELQFVVQHCCPRDAWLVVESTASRLQLACEAIMAKFFMQAVIVTLGEKGYFYFDAEGKCVHSLDHAEDDIVIVDTVGAGDAFAAMFIMGWQAAWPIEKTLANANRFARAICGVRGAVAESDDIYRVM